MSSIHEKAHAIRLLILDMDGVLTDGTLYFSDDHTEFKGFFARDGIGLKLLLKSGVEVAVVTARTSPALEKRMQELGITLIYQGCDAKLPHVLALEKELQLTPSQIAFIGDDLPDLSSLRHVGLSLAVNDADPYIKSLADWTLENAGGRGAVREACELILESQGKLTELREGYP